MSDILRNLSILWNKNTIQQKGDELLRALHSKNLDEAKRMVEDYPLVVFAKGLDFVDRPLILEICMYGDKELLESFIQNGASLSVCDENSNNKNALDFAISVLPTFKERSSEIIKLLLDSDLDNALNIQPLGSNEDSTVFTPKSTNIRLDTAAIASVYADHSLFKRIAEKIADIPFAEEVGEFSFNFCKNSTTLYMLLKQSDPNFSDDFVKSLEFLVQEKKLELNFGDIDRVLGLSMQCGANKLATFLIKNGANLTDLSDYMPQKEAEKLIAEYTSKMEEAEKASTIIDDVDETNFSDDLASDMSAYADNSSLPSSFNNIPQDDTHQELVSDSNDYYHDA